MLTLGVAVVLVGLVAFQLWFRRLWPISVGLAFGSIVGVGAWLAVAIPRAERIAGCWAAGAERELILGAGASFAGALVLGVALAAGLWRLRGRGRASLALATSVVTIAAWATGYAGTLGAAFQWSFGCHS